MWKNLARLRCAKHKALPMGADLSVFVAAGLFGDGVRSCSILQAGSFFVKRMGQNFRKKMTFLPAYSETRFFLDIWWY